MEDSNMEIEGSDGRLRKSYVAGLQRSRCDLEDIRKTLEELKKMMNEEEVFKKDAPGENIFEGERRKLKAKRQYHLPQCPLYNGSNGPPAAKHSGDNDFNSPVQPKLPPASRLPSVTEYRNSLMEIEKLCSLQQQKIKENIQNIRRKTGQWFPDVECTGISRQNKLRDESSFDVMDRGVPSASYSCDTRTKYASPPQQSQSHRPFAGSGELASLRDHGDLQGLERAFSDFSTKNK